MTTTTISMGGAQLTVETEALFRAWLEKSLGIPHLTTPQPIPPTPAEGERYIGTIISADGSGHHLYRQPIERGKKMKWAKALEYATERRAEVPDRVESALMFATREEGEYESEWYWTREQLAGSVDSAWCQGFGSGSQDIIHKGYDCRVVLVRRVPIQSSSH